MRSVLLVLATACCLAAGLSSVASAADPPPGAAISDSLQYVARVPDSAAIVEGKFDRVGGRDVLVTTGRYGFRTYDVSDPAKPQLIGSFQPPEVLGALGPRHDDVDQTSCPGIGTLSAKTRNPKCRSGFYVISYADPTHLKQIGSFVELPVGHTTSCIDDCKFVWTGGPPRGRPPPLPSPVLPGAPRDRASVSGGGLPGGDDGVAQPQTDFIHNPTRPLNGKVHAAGVPDGNMALMTEEDFATPCDQGGRIVAADITSSLGGEGATGSTPDNPFRMTALDSFHPARNAGDTSAAIEECSAHYFELSGSTLAAAWYGEGLRIIDASDARNLRQVGYYYVTGTDPATNPSSLSWDTAWRGDLVYLFDMDRGIEILRLKGGPARSARLASVREPARRADRLAAVPVRGSTSSGGALV